jgi:hypothetical protein
MLDLMERENVKYNKTGGPISNGSALMAIRT